MRNKIILLPYLLLLCNVGNSQNLLNWQETILSDEQRDSDIQVFHCYGIIGEDSISAHYSKTNISNGRLVFYPIFSENNIKPEKYLEQNKDIVLLTNAGYFGTNVSYSLVMNNYTAFAPNVRAVNRDYNGNSTTYYPTRSAFGLTNSQFLDCGYVYTFTNNETYIYPEASPNSTEQPPQEKPNPGFPAGGMPWNVSEAVGGGPMLIRDSIINTDYTAELFPSDITSSYAPRTAVGVNGKGELINLVVDGRQSHSKGVSLQILSEILLELGCVDAINLDGGGSSCMFIADSLLNKPSDGSTRYIPSVLAVKRALCLDLSKNDEFQSINSQYTTLASDLFGFNQSYLYEYGTAASFHFKNIVPAYYRIEYPFDPGQSDSYSDSLCLIVPNQDTIYPILSDYQKKVLINLGIYALSPADSIIIVNENQNRLIPVSGLRLIQVSSGFPDIDLPAKKYHNVHSLGETVPLKFEAYSKHPARLIKKINIEEIFDGQALTLKTINFSPAEFHADSIDYLVSRNVDQVKLRFTVYDELNDSSFVIYSVNLDNTPPTVSLGKNSELYGTVNDTLLFELLVSPANASRLLEELSIYLNPDTDNHIMHSFSPKPQGDTIYYKYILSREDVPGVLFRFIIKDVNGYSSYRDYSLAVNNYVTDRIKKTEINYLAATNSIQVIPGTDLLNSLVKLNIIDISGRHRFSKSFYVENETIVPLPVLRDGLYFLSIWNKNGVISKKLLMTN